MDLGERLDILDEKLDRYLEKINNKKKNQKIYQQKYYQENKMIMKNNMTDEKKEKIKEYNRLYYLNKVRKNKEQVYKIVEIKKKPLITIDVGTHILYY